MSTDDHTDFTALLRAAARLQSIVPGLVLVGGSAASLYAGHRDSHDHDHVVVDLRERFAQVLDSLANDSGWTTARERAGVLVLGSLDGWEAGIRQLRREKPLETVTVDIDSQPLVIPSPVEMLRVKAIMVLTRAATRDYLDFAAVADAVGPDITRQAIATMDDYYDAFTSVTKPVADELIRRLSNPIVAKEDPQTFLNELTLRDDRWRSWQTVAAACQRAAVASQTPKASTASAVVAPRKKLDGPNL